MEYAKILHSIILGVIEGLTEFLPVSSTGHLVIAGSILGFDSNYIDKPEFVNAYNYIIQLGAILAIIILYRKQILGTLRYFMPSKIGFDKSGLRFWLNVVVACIPGTIIEFGFGDKVEAKFFNFVSIAVALIVGGLVMMLADILYRKYQPNKQVIDITFVMAFVIGMFQCLAVFPGVSRSAATIIGGMVCGLSLVAAAQFSFFLAIPVMFGMTILKLIKLGFIPGLGAIDYISLLIGFVVSFVVAMVVVKLFLAILKRVALLPFAIYRIGFAGLILFGWSFNLFK